MPFAMYGFKRYLEAGHMRALIGATAAMVVQSLSCGYYLLYFSPFAAAYVIWEMWRTGRMGERRTWFALTSAAALATVVIAPFVIPYARVSRELQLSRSIPEATRLSADVYSYATASTAERFWGPRIADVFPKPEGELFPGSVPLVLVLIGIVITGSKRHVVESSSRGRLIARLFGLVALVHAVAAVATLLFRRLILDLWLFDVRLGDVTQLLVRGGVAYAVALWLSPAMRARAGAFMRSRGFFVLALVAAAWLSLGPSPQVLGRPVDLVSPYRALWTFIPGFEGLRVPARFAMIVVLMLAVLGAFGAAVLARVRHGLVMLTILSAVFLYEGGAAPFVVNGMSPVNGFATPPARLELPRQAPLVYRAVNQLAADAVLADLPLGEADYDVRAMYYSIERWRPILNGYSGFFPVHYGRAKAALSEVPRHVNLSMQTLRELGATHVIVHEAAYLDAEGSNTTAMLRQLGATQVFRDGSDVLLALP
jgi:hypothetical protein